MKSYSEKPAGLVSVGCLVLMAITMVTTISPAMAKRVPSEQAIGGLTRPERAARQQKLHDEVMTIIPPGVSKAILSIGITQKDRDDLAVRPISGSAPLRVGVVKSISGTIGKPFGKAFNQGVLKNSRDGFVWAMTVKSPNAQAIRVHFTGFSLPDNTEMYFLDANGQADGPYVGKGRNGNGDFWTRSIGSDTGKVVLRYTGITPGDDRARMSFMISDVAHIRGRPPRPQEQTHDDGICSDNAFCLEDANCVSGTPADSAKDAVAKMEWITGQFVNTCSGGLLADTDGSSQIPYFLTANHCTSLSISNLETWFNYTTDSCGGTCPHNIFTGGAPSSDTVGFTVLASSSSSDFTLGTLDQAPPADTVFLGWNNSPVSSTNGEALYRISNANFGPQVYSQHDVDAFTTGCSSLPRGDFIYSDTNIGGTMGGSSGSPVVNAAGEVVGQLYGCCGTDCSDVCEAFPTTTNWAVDGAFAATWPYVAEFLDPQGGCSSDAECNDSDFCTGTESCVSGSCQSSGDPCSVGETCNEGSDSCDVPTCNNDGLCGAGEDCNNCPNDCRQKTNGNPNSRYCCDGDLSDCGDSRCSESGFSCGDDGGGCLTNLECDDGAFCNGIESCSGGTCQSSGGDVCPSQGCDEGSNECVDCGSNKAACSSDSDCCSGNCKNGSCKGN